MVGVCLLIEVELTQQAENINIMFITLKGFIIFFSISIFNCSHLY